MSSFFLSYSSFTRYLTILAYLRLPLYEITAEVWSLDKFHGSFTTLRSQVLARNVQRRMSPVARLCGNLALLGDPVVLWNWKRKGPFFTMSSGNIHHSPTVNTSIWISCENHLLKSFQSSPTVFWRFDLFGITYLSFVSRTSNYYRPHNSISLADRSRARALSGLSSMFKIRQRRRSSLYTI